MLQTKRSIKVNLYADEIRPFTNSREERWMYIGVLAIPEKHRRTILKSMGNDRVKTGYSGVLHFSEITQHQKFLLAKHWLDRVKFDRWQDPATPEGTKGFHFHILGINFSKLQHQAFGDSGSQHQDNIYNRFFRTAINYCLKSCFGNYDEIQILNIYHHAGHLENDDIFEWHPIWKLDKEESTLNFICKEIEFVECNKNNPGDPQITEFIQLIDLLLGTAKQTFDYTSKKEWMVRTAQIIRPLFASLSETFRKGERKKYYVFRRCSVSFFPSKALSVRELEDGLQRAQSKFYNARPLLLPPGENDFQQKSFDFFT